MRVGLISFCAIACVVGVYALNNGVSMDVWDVGYQMVLRTGLWPEGTGMKGRFVRFECLCFSFGAFAGRAHPGDGVQHVERLSVQRYLGCKRHESR
jgi:hypothetical protein